MADVMAETERLLATIKVAIDDVETCAAALLTDALPVDGFWSRAYVRSVFALLEAGMFRVKAFALACRDHADVSFSTVELEHLQAVQSDLPPIEDVEFALGALARVTYAKWTPRVTPAARRTFQRAKATRNRLTHPKTSEDLVVSDAEVLDAHEAMEWIGKQVRELLELIPHTWPAKFGRFPNAVTTIRPIKPS